MAEFDIVLKLCAPPSVDRDALEGGMYEVLQVVENYADYIALGPVVAVDFEGRFIDLGFNVEADALAQAQALVAHVLRVIDEHTTVHFTPSEASAKVTSGDHSDQLCVA